jgi:hypothetical protein
MDDIYLGGVSIKELKEKHQLTNQDLSSFLPADSNDLAKSNIEVHYLGYYIKWIPQESYYYAVENTGFKANPHRTEGTYSKYNSLDDKIDGFNRNMRRGSFGLEDFGDATEDAGKKAEKIGGRVSNSFSRLE